MAYATVDEMKSLIGDDVFLVTVPGISHEQAEAAELELAAASGLADTYISRWLPLAVSTPAALRDAVVWIATFNLAGDKATSHMEKRHDAAMRWLRDVASGKASLGVLEPGTAASAGSAQVSTRERIMGRDRLAGVL